MSTSAHDDGKLEALRRLCGGPRDGALLRVSLANAYLTRAQTAEAVHAIAADGGAAGIHGLARLVDRSPSADHVELL